MIQADQTRPIHVATLLVLLLTVAGSCFLASAGRYQTTGDSEDTLGPAGSIPWGANSWLKSIAESLSFEYAIPTPRGVAVKSLVLGTGAGLASLLVGLSWLQRRRANPIAAMDEEIGSDPPFATDARNIPSPAGEAASADGAKPALPDRAAWPPLKKNMSPLIGAQALVAVYVAWTVLSSQWSRAAEVPGGGATWSPLTNLALAGSLLIAIQFLWSFALAYGLNRKMACQGCVGLVVILTLVAGLAVWYYYGRNPNVRAGFPVGNPLFLSACLLPGVFLAACLLAYSFQHKRAVSRGLAVIALLACLGVLGWAGKLADARSSIYLGLPAGLGAVAFFAGGRRVKISVVSLGAVAALLVGAYFLKTKNEFSATGRGATIRSRLHAWDYAVELLSQRPLTGLGTGGFTLCGDALASADARNDSEALNARIAHVHNEWLETATDHGALGLTVLLLGLGLTLHAGLSVLPKIANPLHRWCLIGLLAALVAMIAEECLDVALRAEGFPTVFYGALGLTWAVIAGGGSERKAPAWKWCGMAIGGPLLGLGAFLAVFYDFRGARAQFETNTYLEKEDWATAVDLGEFACRTRLLPQRRLAAYYDLADLHLFIAEGSQLSCFQKLDAYVRDRGRSDAVLRLALEDRSLSEAHIAAGIKVAKNLAYLSPNYWGSNALLARFYEIKGQFAQADAIRQARLAETAPDEQAKKQRLESAAELRRASLQDAETAAKHLEVDLQRRPMDRVSAVRCVMLAPNLPIDKALNVLACPLRHMGTDSGMIGALQVLSSRPDFDAAIAPLAEAAKQIDPELPPSEWPVVYAPEILRIQAIIDFYRGRFAEAMALAEQARPMSERLRPWAPMALSMTLKELAHYQFFAHLDHPQPAIETLHSALEALPPTPELDPERENLRSKLLSCYLAAGDEAAAAQLIKGQNLEEKNRVMALRYATLCDNVIHVPGVQLPPAYMEWIRRAIELNPELSQAWRLGGQLELLLGNYDKAIESFRHAMKLGEDKAYVVEALDGFLRGKSQDPPPKQVVDFYESLLAEGQDAAAKQ